MGKARKRQKTGQAAASAPVDHGPLGALDLLEEESPKDDEERRLESLLFGTPYTPSINDGNNKNVFLLSDDEDGDVLADGAKELQNLEDTDLFYVDDGEASTSHAIPDELIEDLEEEDSDEEKEEEESVVAPVPVPSTRKAAAWADEDDTTLTVSLATDNRLRKLRDAPGEDAVGGREYERRLRRQYEKINPTPDWAASARKKLHPTKRRREGEDEEEEDEEEDVVSELLTSTGGILDGTRKSTTLVPGTLAIERLRDANQAAKSEGPVKVVQFHPSPQIPVLLTTGADRRLRLFNIDGHTNPHLQTIHIPALPLSNAMFHPSGSSVLLTGPRPFFYTYDLQSGTTHRSPRGLWGTTFNERKTNDASMETCAFDPTGSVLAVAGRRGYIHLVDWKSGAGQVVASLKQSAGVKDLWWAKGGSGEGTQLMSLGENAEVHVWDVGERRCVRKWQDDGGFGSSIMQGDRKGGYLALGSNSGLVNVYGPDGAMSTSEARPKPLKTIGNLTTSISALRFNHDSQLLAIASDTKKDQLRMIHLPSLTAFGNWPTSSTPLGRVTSIDFSAGSEYVALGNNRGRVLLYNLKDFSR